MSRVGFQTIERYWRGSDRKREFPFLGGERRGPRRKKRLKKSRDTVSKYKMYVVFAVLYISALVATWQDAL